LEHKVFQAPQDHREFKDYKVHPMVLQDPKVFEDSKVS
jgi:hypothetical protein